MESSQRMKINPRDEITIAGTIYNAILKDDRPRFEHRDRSAEPILEMDGDTYIHIGSKENGAELWRECIFNEMGGSHLGEKILNVKCLTHKNPLNRPIREKDQTGQ